MKYTNQEILDLVQHEGIGKVIESISANKIKDTILSTLWEDINELMEEIKSYLENNEHETTDEDDPDEEEYE